MKTVIVAHECVSLVTDINKYKADRCGLGLRYAVKFYCLFFLLKRSKVVGGAGAVQQSSAKLTDVSTFVP